MHTIQFGVSVLVSISLSQAQLQKMNNLPRFCFSQTQKVPRISLLYLIKLNFARQMIHFERTLCLISIHKMGKVPQIDIFAEDQKVPHDPGWQDRSFLKLCSHV